MYSVIAAADASSFRAVLISLWQEAVKKINKEENLGVCNKSEFCSLSQIKINTIFLLLWDGS